MKTTLLALCLAVIATQLTAADWPQFRGAHFNNEFRDTTAPVQFAPGTNELWKVSIPNGLSSPVIAGNRMFLTGFTAPKQLETLCLDRTTGKILWRQAVDAATIETFLPKLGSPAAPSCATDGQRVVSYFGTCGLICHDLDGNQLWTVQLPMIRLKQRWGSGSSPIIHNGTVYVLRDEQGEAKGIYAFDVKNGKQLWHNKREGFSVSYGSPVIWDGCVVVLGDTRAKGYDLKTGADRFVVRGLAAHPCTTPAVGADGNLYIASFSPGSQNDTEPMPTYEQMTGPLDKDQDGKVSTAEAAGTMLADFMVVLDNDNNGFFERPEWDQAGQWMKQGSNAAVALRPGGKGDITETHVLWKREKGLAYVASPLAYDGQLYLAKDGGLLTAYDLKTGEPTFLEKKVGAKEDIYASPIACAGHIYLATAKGKVLVLKPGKEAEIVHQTDLGEPIFATPVVAGNTLYIRTVNNLWAFR